MSAPSENDLRAAVIAAPEEDAPRLAYAKKLSERGDPRGQFIELQVRYRPVAEDYPLFAAAQKLLKQHEKEWLADFPPVTEPVFQRGFLFSGRFEPQDVTAELFARTPLVELDLAHGGPELERIAQLSGLATVRKLTVRSGNDAGFSALCGSPHLRLHTLHAYLGKCHPETMAALANAPSAAGLRELQLSYTTLSEDAARALGGSTQLRHLERLYVDSCGLTRVAASALTPLLSAAKELSMGNNPRAFASGPFLERLELHNNGLTDEDVRALAGLTTVGSLRKLLLNQNTITDTGVAALAASPNFTHLAELDLGDNQITETGVEALAGGAGMPVLELLRISGNPLRTVEIEDWRDWDGSWVGSGPNSTQWTNFLERYQRRFKIS